MRPAVFSSKLSHNVAVCRHLAPSSCFSPGLKRTMKLWHSLTTCCCLMLLLLLLSAVHASPLQPRRSRARRGRAAAAAEVEESPLELPPVHIRLSVSSPGSSGSSSRSTPGKSGSKSQGQWEETLDLGEKYVMEESLSDEEYEDVVDLIKVTISRIQRSSSSSAGTSSPSAVNTRTRHKRAKKRGPSPESRGPTGRKVKGGGGGRGQGCVLKQIQLNVTDLGLGYRSSEEMIFRYCSGPCRKSETNYDKILSNLAHHRRFPPKDRPAQACCRPVAFDDDVSFLDDNLVYHTVRKHSARKCACV